MSGWEGEHRGRENQGTKGAEVEGRGERVWRGYPLPTGDGPGEKAVLKATAEEQCPVPRIFF